MKGLGCAKMGYTFQDAPTDGCPNCPESGLRLLGEAGKGLRCAKLGCRFQDAPTDGCPNCRESGLRLLGKAAKGLRCAKLACRSQDAPTDGCPNWHENGLRVLGEAAKGLRCAMQNEPSRLLDPLLDKEGVYAWPGSEKREARQAAPSWLPLSSQTRPSARSSGSQRGWA